MKRKQRKVEWIHLEGFVNPSCRDAVVGVLEMWDDGFPRSLIAEACNMSVRKVSAIINAKNIPKEWRRQATLALKRCDH